MIKEIGSSFWINPTDLKKDNKDITPFSFGLKGKDYVWTSTCRSAIALALKNIAYYHNLPKVVVLPTFSCTSVYQSFEKAGYEIRQYSVNRNMEICDNLIDIADGAGVLLIHKYFGFDTNKNLNKIIDVIRNKNVQIIEDKTQCLYSQTDPINADYYVASMRKWHGIPDGGFLVSNKPIIDKPKVEDDILEKLKIEAEILKYNYIILNQGEKRQFLELFSLAENKLDNQKEIYKISKISYKLQSNLDINFLVNSRRNNYNELCKHLNDKSIVVFKKLDDFITPLYCPIYVKNRIDLQIYLREHNIFAPVLWPKEGILGKSNDDGLYQYLLSLPIDQRYSKDDMIYMANCINEFFEINK